MHRTRWINLRIVAPGTGEGRISWSRLGLILGGCVLAAVLGVAAHSGDVAAQSEAATAAVEPETGATGEITADEVNVVAREIWCPLCSGVRLDGCELKACDQMKDVIAMKLAEGEDTESIKQYFVDQYGPQVLGEPPREGFNWLAWILPVVALVLGGAFFWQKTQGLVRPGGGAESDPAASNGTGPAKDELTAEQADDQPKDYEQILDEELTKYG